MAEVSHAGPRPAGTGRNEEVRAAMVAHHAGLVAGLEERVRTAEGAVDSGRLAEAELGAVAEYLQGEVIPHAAAEEIALYPLARTGALGSLIQAMVTEHGWLGAEAALVAETPGARGAGRARAIAAVFALHAGKENDLVLPALSARPDVDLASVLNAMSEYLSGAAGGGEEPDVRVLPRASPHDTIFARLGDLQSGQSLVLLNDHDPQPLHYQLDALWPGAYEWSYLARGPELWRVRVRRQETVA
ncbi:MAG: DUF2249 domain-containing protein [Acidimicrobiales bacterium]